MTREIHLRTAEAFQTALSRYRDRPRLFTFAESCTGGLLSSAVTSFPGISAVYPGGFVTYANEAKIKLLGVSPETLKMRGAVSPECAVEMAKGAKRAMETDFALSITGVAGPGGGSAEKPVGTVWLGMVTIDDRIFARRLFFPRRSRLQVRTLSVHAALRLLTRGLLHARTTNVDGGVF